MSFGNEREFIDHLQSKEGKEQAMKCPLIRIGEAFYDKEWKAIVVDCLKEECAWWDNADEQCDFLTISFELNRIGLALQLIEQKMPHAG